LNNKKTLIIFVLIGFSFSLFSNAYGDTVDVTILPGAASNLGPTCDKTNSCFSKTNVYINVGDGIRWHNETTEEVFLLSGKPTDSNVGELFTRAINPGESALQIVPESGTFYYYDLNHPWITGTIVSRESAPSIASSTSEIRFSKYNSIHGFSLNYPSGWYIDDASERYGDNIDYVWFTPKFNDYNVFIRISFHPGDFGYRGLSDKAYESKLSSEAEELCFTATLNEDGYVCSNFYLLDAFSIDDNGNTWHVIEYEKLYGYSDGTSDKSWIVRAELPFGPDTWAITGIFDKDLQMQNNYADIIAEAVGSFSLAGAPTSTPPTFTQEAITEFTEQKERSDGNALLGAIFLIAIIAIIVVVIIVIKRR